MRYRQATYGEIIDGHRRAIERLDIVAKSHPGRGREAEQGRQIIAEMELQMKCLGKRRSSCFYGFDTKDADR